MSNRIVIRDRVPDDSTLHVWVAPADDGSKDKYQAYATLVDDKNLLIWENADISDSMSEKTAKKKKLKKNKVYVLAIKVFFGDSGVSATTNHKLTKKDGVQYGSQYPYLVPENPKQRVGRQTIGIRMLKSNQEVKK